jgi:hypothetical protein
MAEMSLLVGTEWLLSCMLFKRGQTGCRHLQLEPIPRLDSEVVVRALAEVLLVGLMYHRRLVMAQAGVMMSLSLLRRQNKIPLDSLLARRSLTMLRVGGSAKRFGSGSLALSAGLHCQCNG